MISREIVRCLNAFGTVWEKVLLGLCNQRKIIPIRFLDDGFFGSHQDITLVNQQLPVHLNCRFQHQAI